mmetsp:Transcript_89468/g.154967  ORF Transcript_89468/g.154967 Transcript_89468/m.154967 type:complete len:85 (+) Transcript_89468:87-341(+)
MPPPCNHKLQGGRSGLWCVAPLLVFGHPCVSATGSGVHTKGEIAKVHNNGKYDVLYVVDGKRLIKVNVPGTALSLQPPSREPFR